MRRLLNEHTSSRNNIALLATGGYGRCDNSYGSDLDLIILHRDDFDRYEAAIRRLITSLWDKGWSPGQTLLRLEEVDRYLLTIPDRASALLEARIVWGDSDLAKGLDYRLSALFDEEVWNRFIELKMEEFHKRRDKFGPVPRVIEPHLKEQAGGLRDLHHVLWAERARAAYAAKWSVLRKRSSAIDGLFRRLRRSRLLNDRELNDMRNAFDLLLRLRESLHQVSRRRLDILGVPEQTEVALHLGYDGNEDERMRKVMRETFIAVEKIARFADEFVPLLVEYGVRNLPEGRPLPFFQGAAERGGRVDIRKEAMSNVATDPLLLFSLVGHCAEHNLSLSGRTRHELRRQIHEAWEDLHRPRIWARDLRPYFEKDKGFGSWLRRLSELDAISPWLPEWREISGLTTGSYYHRYTVDEHTLRAIEELDRLPDDGPEGLPQSLWAQFEPKQLIHWTLFFHDLAKGREGDHSEEGARMARAALERLGFDEIIDDVTTLVRYHLKMEQTAFRRDITNPMVIGEFTHLLGSQRLVGALYLLTVCDLRAVKTGVWSRWKGRLLAELYLNATRWLEGGEAKPAPTVDEETRKVTALLQARGEEERVHNFIASMKERYRVVIPSEEIARHYAAVEAVRNGVVQWEWLIEQQKDVVILTLVTHDRIGLLADATGLMVSQGVGVREARIFTRDDGIVVDRFRGEDNLPQGPPLAERLTHIPTLWGDLVQGKINVRILLERHSRRSRYYRRPAARVETEVMLARSGNRYLVDVSGSDSVGLLYRLCAIFASKDLDVRSARVTNRIDGIMNAFLLQDPQGYLDREEHRNELVKMLRKELGTGE
ncbi:HD domain-containing protein [bacterium]|nr:HD domain-containing protein [bacterium]